MRATVAHDSYERLVEIPCHTSEHNTWIGRKGLATLPDVLQDAAAFGINSELLSEAANKDSGVAEFCRFYLERREQEISAAGSDARKEKKLEG